MLLPRDIPNYTHSEMEEICVLRDFYTHVHADVEKMASRGNVDEVKKEVTFLLEGMKKYRVLFSRELKELERIVK